MHYSSVTVMAVWMTLGMGSFAFAVDATNRHRTLPGQNSSFYDDNATFLQFEDADRSRDAGLVGFVVSGGGHPAVAGMTSAAFATEGYTMDGLYVTQSAVAINYTTQGCTPNDTAWVILDSAVTGNLANFTRVAGTHYLVDCVSSTQPVLPSSSTWLMVVGISGSALSTVVDLRGTPPGLAPSVAPRVGELPYLVSGCTPVVPSASLTFAAFPCAGYVVKSTGALGYVAQTSVALGPLSGGDGTYWLVLYADVVTPVVGWTHPFGTMYLWAKSATLPTIPAQGVLFAKITVAGGVITAVLDQRVMSSAEARTGTLWPTARVTETILIREAIQRAHDACPTQGCILALPPGIYTLDATPIFITKGVTLQGAGSRQTVLATGHATNTFLDIQTIYPVTLADFSITASVTRTGGSTITLSGNAGGTLSNQGSVFRNITVENQAVAIDLQAAAYWTMQGVWVNRFSSIGLNLRNMATADEGDGAIVNSLFVADGTPGSKGIHWESGGGLKITNSKVLGATAVGIDLVSTGNTGAMIVTGNSIEGFLTTGIQVVHSGAGTLTRFTVTGNEVLAGGNSTTGIYVGGIAQNAVNDGVVANNMVKSGTGAVGIHLDKSAVVSVTGNTIDQDSGTAGVGLKVTGNGGGNYVAGNHLYNAMALTVVISDPATLVHNPASTGMTFGQLSTMANTSQTACVDCVGGSGFPVCLGGGTGAQAFRVAGAWRCL